MPPSRNARMSRTPAPPGARLVFIDETWASTNMTPRYGRCERGKTLHAAEQERPDVKDARAAWREACFYRRDLGLDQHDAPLRAMGKRQEANRPHAFRSLEDDDFSGRVAL